MKRRARRGFTLLEVMVSMAILGICLAAVFSTEAGAVRMATRARKMGFATLLARCKMGEVEEDVAVNGMPTTLTTGTDDCCQDAEIEGFQCTWEIEPILMPDTMFADSGGDDANALLEGAAPAAATGTTASDALPTDPSSLLSGGGDVDGLAALAMQYVYPVLKPAFEAQIRRATVKVSWHEGSVEHSFDVTQYLVADSSNELNPAAASGTTGSQGVSP